MAHITKTTTRLSTLFVLIFLLLSTISVSANTLISDKECNYIEKSLYMPFSDINKNFPIFGTLMGNNCVNVSNGVNNMFSYGFQVFLGIVSLIAVVQVSVAGIQWMVQDAGSNSMGKTTARQKLTNSIIGLVLALSSWLILSTVNKRIVYYSLDFKTTGGPLAQQIQKGINSAANIAPVEKTDPTSGSTGTSGTTGTNNANIGGSSKFPNQTWADHARREIEASGLNSLSPKDAAKFFPDGKPSTEGYLRLFEEMIKRESSFDPDKTYPESMGYDSIGLFQLSVPDFGGKYTAQQLKDPMLNLTLGIQIFKDRVQRGNCIACGDTRDPAVSGAAAYWRVLNSEQSGGKVTEIVNALK